ncbi:sensor histidine kinase [Flammeovirga agarivorans]|uniref:histidine kinase n=1 Tax=Flammeovirga agarivorans TaxID=2726742 RepID=A0A7X8XXS9_9BACT|nr:ATP-binding protein [Flammeovirga agarivorans]NLR93380.1 GAF domain-containing protein [Flammeovirga agarivorans]
MIQPVIPKNELERLEELKSYSILDTLEEDDYDNLTAIASEICQTPISLVSLVDDKRQWFKSHHGIDADHTPKEVAFCAHAINKPKEVLIVNDSREDVRFHDNPLVVGETKVIFYAGVPLVSEKGLPMGTLCVIDHEPRELTSSQVETLRALGQQVMRLMELRKSKKVLTQTVLTLEEKNKELDKFAYVAAHDLKSPLNNILNISELLSEQYGATLDITGNKLIGHIIESSKKLRTLIVDILNYSKNQHLIKDKKDFVTFKDIKNSVQDYFFNDFSTAISFNTDVDELLINKTALDQVLINIISNAIKYNDKDLIKVEIGISETDRYYQFYVRDNGSGIDEKDQKEIFELFKVISSQDRFGSSGNGIGLATVKKIVQALGGEICLESEKNVGTTFHFSIEK